MLTDHAIVLPRPPGYTGNIAATVDKAPYDEYNEDISALSSFLHSGFTSSAVSNPYMTSTRAAQLAHEELW